MKTVAMLSEQERKELFSETATAMGVTAAALPKKIFGYAGYCCMFLKMGS